MTERALPAIGTGVRTRPPASGAANPPVRPNAGAGARPAVSRKEAILSTPARAGMLLGASAAVYAVTLAGIAGLQAESEATIAAARAPYLEELAATRAANEAIELRVAKADAEIRALVATYGAVGENVATFQERLDTLTTLVADVRGRAAALPDRIRLPAVSTVRVSGSGGGTSAPATSGRTGASGG